MSRSQWLISVLLVCHLSGLVIGAIPRPGELLRVQPPRHPDRNPLAALLTPPLDAAAAAFIPVHDATWRLTTPLRTLSEWYVGLTGLGQRWRMFMNPPTYDEYLKARFHIRQTGADHEIWTASQLVFPSHREDRVRLLQSFRDSYTDKAIAIALADFVNTRTAVAFDDSTADPSTRLDPLARHFAADFARRHLRPDQQVVGTELWRARVPNPAPGTPAAADAAARRQTLLRRYYDGPVEDRSRPRPLALGTTVVEEELRWVLEYIGR